MLRVERSGEVVLWKIFRPELRNALSLQMLRDLRSATEAVQQDRSVRAVILTGTEDTFCSGGDLAELRSIVTREQTEAFARLGAEVCDGIEALQVPVIAAVTGIAYGGGVELALACDLRIADDKAKFSLRQVRLGITTGWGGFGRLTRIVGRSSAARLLYAGHEVGALEARGLRLVDYVADRGAAVTLALAWAADIAQGSPQAIAEYKRLLRCAGENAELRHEEQESLVNTWLGPDHNEAVAAFFERRVPVWNRR